jgi:hypothetical protein
VAPGASLRAKGANGGLLKREGSGLRERVLSLSRGRGRTKGLGQRAWVLERPPRRFAPRVDQHPPRRPLEDSLPWGGADFKNDEKSKGVKREREKLKA